jgi:hypothetical protein
MAASTPLRLLLVFLIVSFCSARAMGQDGRGVSAVDSARVAAPGPSTVPDSSLAAPVVTELPFELRDDAGTGVRRNPLSMPFHPLVMGVQCLAGAMSGAFGGTVGTLALGFAGIGLGAVGGVPIGVLIAGARNGGPKGGLAYLVSAGGAFVGFRAGLWAIDRGAGLTQIAIVTIAASVLSYQLLALIQNTPSTSDTTASRLAELRSGPVAHLHAEHMRMLIPIDVQWRCEVLSIRF